MDFAIAVVTEDRDHVYCTIVDLFSSDARGDLFAALGVSPERFEKWRASTRFDPMIPQLRNLSALSFVDDDAVSLEPAALKEEIQRAVRAATGEEARRLLLTLERAATMASEAGGRVEVFTAAAWHRAGNSYSQRRV